MLEYSGVARDIIALEVARALVRICSVVTNIEQGNKLIPVLERISLLTNSLPIKHVCQIGFTLIVQKRYRKLSESNRLAEKNYPDGLSMVDPANGSLALLLTSIYLTSNEQDRAIELLKNVVSLDKQEQKLCQIVASILEGQIPAFENMIPIHLNTDAKTNISYDLLNATIAFMTKHVAEGSKMLFEAFCKDAETTTSIVNMKRAVPYCCTIAPQERNFPPELIKLLYNLANDVQGEEIASIARCLTIIGETEHALSLWKRLKHENSMAKKSWSQDVAQLLCHVAVNDYHSLKAVQTLREVAYWVSGTEQGKLCNRLANRLERQHAARNLLNMMFPAMDEAHKVSGRYAYLVEVIGQHPQLKEALTKNEASSVRREWGTVVTQSLKSNVRLLHFRAVGYRDYVLSQRHRSHEMGDWIKYTLLWVLMLCSEEFWIYFSADRAIGESGERIPLDEIEQDTLFYNALDHILALHQLYAGQTFAANNYQEAKTHFYCLDLCQKGEHALLVALGEQKLSFPFSVDARRIDWVQTRAGKIFKEWTDNLVREAKKATENVEVLKNLNVSKDYETGIRILEPFIGLDIPVLRVLTTCLQWYNGWLDDLVSIKEYSPLRSVLSSASNIATKLTAFCMRGEGYKRENQVLAEYFSWQGFISYYSSKEQCIEYYRQALIWNPANSTAQSILQNLEEKEDSLYEEDVLF